MTKITAYIPEPTPEYDVNNQRQILESLTTIKQQLNTTFLNEQREELERFNFFNG
jgi:ABC-type dipeptide/oligopeptide/nickel transport system ATPase subunit